MVSFWHAHSQSASQRARARAHTHTHTQTHRQARAFSLVHSQTHSVNAALVTTWLRFNLFKVKVASKRENNVWLEVQRLHYKKREQSGRTIIQRHSCKTDETLLAKWPCVWWRVQKKVCVRQNVIQRFVLSFGIKLKEHSKEALRIAGATLFYEYCKNYSLYILHKNQSWCPTDHLPDFGVNNKLFMFTDRNGKCPGTLHIF